MKKARVIKPKDGEDFAMQTDTYTESRGDTPTPHGELVIVGRGRNAYIRFEHEREIGCGSISGPKALRALANAIRRALRPTPKRARKARRSNR